MLNIHGNSHFTVCGIIQQAANSSRYGRYVITSAN
eukprot:jgi/Antlo1/1436/112